MVDYRTGAHPRHLTLRPTLCVVLGVTTMKEAFAAFANPTIFLFMGGFIIAKAMTVNGIDRASRMASCRCAG